MSKFKKELETIDQQTREPTIYVITALDPLEDSCKTYKGGCEFLLNWFHNETDQHRLN